MNTGITFTALQLKLSSLLVSVSLLASVSSFQEDEVREVNEETEAFPSNCGISSLSAILCFDCDS